jgi:DNA-binding NarL/FixJ family response regulator
VAIIEDDQVTRNMLRVLVVNAADMKCVGAWGEGEKALAELPAYDPDVVLVDLGLPGISGVDCMKKLIGLLPTAAMVVVSSNEDEEQVFEALHSGAHGYIIKGGEPQDLLAGIRAARQGGAPLSPQVAGMKLRNFQKSSPKVIKESIPELTPREIQLLEWLAQGKVPKEAAAEMNISYETARDYLKRIYRKLGVRSRTEAVLRYIRARDGGDAAPN